MSEVCLTWCAMREREGVMAGEKEGRESRLRFVKKAEKYCGGRLACGGTRHAGPKIKRRP